jgi:branched-chain amino acid transport system substrate-binding protein
MTIDGNEQGSGGSSKRRSLLKTLGSGAVVALAGCSGSDDGGGGDGGGGGGGANGGGGDSDGTDQSGDGGDSTAQDGSASGDSGSDPIHFGGILPLTGAVANPAQWIQRAWNIRVDQVNQSGGLLGRDVELTVYDTELDNQQMQTLTQQLVTQDDIDVFLGPYPTITAPVISPILSRENMTALHIFWPASMAQEYQNGEGSWPNQYGFTSAMLTYPRTFVNYLDSLSGDIRPERIAMIGRNDVVGEDSATGWRNAIEDIDDMEIVVDERFEVGSTDLSPVVRNVEGTDADVIAGNSYAAGSQLFAQAVADIGLNPDFLWFLLGPQVPAWLTSLEATGEYVFGSTPYAYSVPTDSNEELFEIAQNEYGSLPHYSFGFGAIQFDIYRQAIENAGELSQQALADSFDSMTFSSVTGELTFENNYAGNSVPMFLTQAQGEELPIVYPSDLQTSEPVAPLPGEWPSQNWP